MNDLFNQFASAFGKKEELSPADEFLAKKNKELEEKQQAELDALEFPEETVSAMQPSKEFDEIPLIDEQQERLEEIRDINPDFSPTPPFMGLEYNNPNYDSMPQGLKEAQQRNGIRNHGLTNKVEWDTKGVPPVSYVEESMKLAEDKYFNDSANIAMSGQRGLTGSFEWTDKSKTKVAFVQKPNGTFYVNNPDDLTPQIKSVIDRKFPNADYIGTGDKVLYTAGIDPSSGENTSQAAIIKYEDGIATEIIRNPKSTDLNFEKGQADLFEKLNVLPEIPENCISPKDFNSLMLGESGTMYQNPKTDKIYIAIDPGKSGGISAVDTNGNVIFKKEMPLLNDELDAVELSAILSDAMSNYNCVLVVEDVHSIFGVSASNNFVFGWVCGQIDAVVKLSKIKHEYIQPKFWQKNCWTNSDMIYKPLKEGQKRASVDTKATSLITAMRLFPREDLRGHVEIKYYGDTKENQKLNRAGAPIPTKKNKPHDGIVDSLLMAEVARRLNL